MWKYRFSELSSFYILESEIEFNPGSKINYGSNGNYSNWLNLNNQFKITPKQIHDQDCYNDICVDFTGGQIIFRDSAPSDNLTSKMINSIYDSNRLIGYAYENGFSTNLISNDEFSDYNKNINFKFDKEYDKNGPILIYEENVENNSSEWTYKYEFPLNVSNKIKTFYMFEMNNQSDFQESEMLFETNYTFEVSNGQERRKFNFTNFINFNDLESDLR